MVEGIHINNGQLGYDFKAYGYLLNEFVNAYTNDAGSFESYEAFYQFVSDISNNDELTNTIVSRALDAFIKGQPTKPGEAFFDPWTKALTSPQKGELLVIINFLIADQLYKHLDYEYLKEKYDPFIKLLQDNNRVDIISLNHDLLTENIIKELTTRDYSDGFSKSPKILVDDAGEAVKTFQNSFSNCSLPYVNNIAIH